MSAFEASGSGRFRLDPRFKSYGTVIFLSSIDLKVSLAGTARNHRGPIGARHRPRPQKRGVRLPKLTKIVNPRQPIYGFPYIPAARDP
jgi:hypothetical protein